MALVNAAGGFLERSHENDTAKALLARFKVPMPNQELSDENIHNLIRYFRWAGTKPPPAGTDTASAGGTP